MNSECPLCSGIDLSGSRGYPASGSDFDVVLRRGPGVVLTPTKGTLVPGYVMAVATEHVLSFGKLGTTTLLVDIAPWLVDTTTELADKFGNYMIFEHGSASESERRGGCIVHAHMHLIPASGNTVDAVLAEASWNPVGGLEETAQHEERGYAYLGWGDASWLSTAPSFPGQWIRRIIARAVGKPDEWDWAVFPGADNLETTLDRISGADFDTGTGTVS